MPRTEIPYTRYYEATMRRMGEDGLLLVSSDGSADAAPNVMTIGWGAIGISWGRPCLLIMVRPSRYTYQLLEKNGDFTVNVAPPSLNETIAYCGTVSGRDRDKFAERGLTPIPASQVNVPLIAECVIHYECRTLHRNDLIPDNLQREIRKKAYPRGDFHRLYYAEILATSADEEAAAVLDR